MNELPATLAGTTKPYQGNGRKLGYPTANISTPTELADGVYFGFADLADYRHQPAIVFIGTPTTMGDTERRVEAYLLDIADSDYYDQRLKLEIHHFHRANQTFDSVEALQQAMDADLAAARAWFADQG